MDGFLSKPIVIKDLIDALQHNLERVLAQQKSNKEGDDEIMEQENYSIVFSSSTGNTKKLADAVYEILPKDKCDYFGENDSKIPPSDLLYIGFWTDKGSADTKTLELLAKLKNKKIFLFGTAGFGGSDVYFEKILRQVKQSIDSSNAVIGEYMCQGKMPQSVRERYVKMKENPEHPANLDMLIANFDCALSHPDMDDLEKLKKIIKK